MEKKKRKRKGRKMMMGIKNKEKKMFLNYSLIKINFQSEKLN